MGLSNSKIKQQGFSLLEVLIALFLIAMMLVLYESAIKAISLSRNAKDQQIALRIATHEVEQLRGSGYDLLPANGSSTFTDTQLAAIPQSSATLVVSDNSTKTKDVVVTVTWREPGTGSDHTVVLQTLITKVGGLK